MKTPLTFFAIFLFTILMTSCQKDSPSPEEVEQKLFQDIQGKWEYEAGLLQLNNKGGLRINSSLISSPKMPKARIKADLENAFIEFLEGGTFFISDNELSFEQGNYTVKSDTVVLSGIGEMIGFKANKEKGSFRFNYGGRSVNITATKAKQIETSSRTQLLCRFWEDDYDQFEIDNGYKLGPDEDISFVVDGREYKWSDFNSKTLFTKNGTLISLGFLKDMVVEVYVDRWIWHPKRPNAYVTGWFTDSGYYNGEILMDGDPSLDINNFIDYNDILELTTKRLIVKHSWWSNPPHTAPSEVQRDSNINTYNAL